jgi:Flp pilus assembly protein TadD
MRAAASAFDAGDLMAAEPLFREIVSRNPRDHEAWHVLALIACRSGRPMEAIGYATQAHRLDSRNPLYLNTLGVASAEAQDFEKAVSWLKRALKQRPTHAESHYNLGSIYTKLGRLDEAERSYLRGRQLDPGKAEIANNLAALYSRAGRYAEALPLLAEARRRLPNDEAVAINSAIVALATEGSAAAISGLVSFVARNPDAAAVRAQLARRLLAEGQFAEGWREYAWRRQAPATELPDDLSGKRVLLLPDQGLGDQLFFLRFAPSLRKRASHVAFACPAPLRALLEGTEAIDELRSATCVASDFDLAIPVGDLPRLLRDTSTPPPLPVTPRQVAEWERRLASLGSGPYLGITWRAGSKRKIDMDFAFRGEDPLHKEVTIDLLAAAVRGWKGTIVVLQRNPNEGEIAGFSRELGRSAHDLSMLNDDLPAMCAVLSLIDEYVGVSNTNMHLRAAVGRPGRVLVPFPPEFRWMSTGGSSPWFPGFVLYRQAAGRDWQPGLGSLAKNLCC